MYIDAHTHLITSSDEIKLQTYLENLNPQLEQNHISYILSNCTTPANFSLIEYENMYPRIFSAIGINRNLAKDSNHHTQYLEILRTSLEKFSPKAIGETGLDYSEYFGEVQPIAQQKILRAEIQMAREFQLPIVIHAVQSDKDLLEILIEEKACEIPIQIHNIFLKSSTVQNLVDMGCYFSLSWNHFVENELFHIPPLIPIEQILLETDAPYAPTPRHPKGPSSPIDIPTIYDVYANLMNISENELQSQIQRNFRKMFKL